MRGPRFFLALPNEPNICAQRNFRVPQGIEGRQLGEDGCLVIASRSRKDALLAINFANHRSKRLAVPFWRSNWLAVVMGIEDDRAFCTRNNNLAVNDGRSSPNRE